MAAPTDAQLASPGRRLVSSVIDNIITRMFMAIFVVLLMTQSYSNAYEGIFLGAIVIMGINYIFLVVRYGYTIGQFIVGIKIVNENGKNLSYGSAFIRLIGLFVSGLILGIGFIWILIDKKQQGWHDKLANCYVVKSKK